MNKTDYDGRWYEPRHDKPYLYHMKTTKTQISLPIWEVWSTLYNSLHRQYNSCRLYTWKMWCRPVRVSPGRKPLKTGFLIRLTWEWYTIYVNYIRMIYEIHVNYMRMIYELYDNYMRMIYDIYVNYIRMIYEIYVNYTRMIYEIYDNYIVDIWQMRHMIYELWYTVKQEILASSNFRGILRSVSIDPGKLKSAKYFICLKN